MFRPFTEITIKQITPFVRNGKTTERNKIFTLDFNTDYFIESTWEKHTDICSVKFPKNIKLFGTEDGLFTYSRSCNLILGGTGTSQSPNVNAFGEDITNSPLIMKGDSIEINDGYLFRNENDQDNFCSTGSSLTISNFQLNKNSKLSTNKSRFKGYVSSIGSDTPIELKCEDNFYLLKRTPFDKTVWNKEESKGNTSLYGLMQHILDLTNEAFPNPIYPTLTLLNIPTSITAKFSLGYLEIGDMTCGQLMDKLKTQYKFYSAFREDVLQFGYPIYTDGVKVSDSLQANSSNYFLFRDIYNRQNQIQASANIFPSHDLEYKNKEDIVLSATVECKVINIIKGKSTISGLQKTRALKLKVLVYWDIITSSYKFYDISTGKTPPKKIDGQEGERHQFFYPVDNTNPNPTIQNLVDLGIEQLKRYHYTGFHGCFTTFGFPFVQWNDNVNILDPIYADRNGQYKVKKVIYRGGLKGLSQEIHLDYRIDIPLSKNVESFQMF